MNNLKHFILALIFLGVNACKEKVSSEKPFQPKDWQLVFEDNFDQDLSQWNVWYGGAYNNEIQLYSPEQLTLNNGILRINTKRQAIQGPTTNVDSTAKDFEYVSGRIESKTLFGFTEEEGDQQYRFVARLKLPSGQGMWPAYWTYGDPWPTAGEIDILEARGNEPLQFQSNLFYGPNPGINVNVETEVEHAIKSDLTADFHVYEMIWNKDNIQILFDGTLLHTYEANKKNNIAQMAGKLQKVVFNTAVGGWFIGDNIDSAQFADSATMEVDWVRVFKR